LSLSANVGTQRLPDGSCTLQIIDYQHIYVCVCVCVCVVHSANAGKQERNLFVVCPTLFSSLSVCGTGVLQAFRHRLPHSTLHIFHSFSCRFPTCRTVVRRRVNERQSGSLAKLQQRKPYHETCRVLTGKNNSMEVGLIKKRIPFIFNDESTGSCICLRLDLYMSYLQGCAFNTRLQ
jgi:hypothetical protein